MISNRAKTQNANNNNNTSNSKYSNASKFSFNSIQLIFLFFCLESSGTLLDEMDPLASTKNSTMKTPQSFLGENSGLVNLDQLIKTSLPSNNGQAYNPFGDLPQQQKTNLFQQQMQPVNILITIFIDIKIKCKFYCFQKVPSINQLKSQSPFPVTLSQDPWAPVNSNNTNQVSFFHFHYTTNTYNDYITL